MKIAILLFVCKEGPQKVRRKIPKILFLNWKLVSLKKNKNSFLNCKSTKRNICSYNGNLHVLYRKIAENKVKRYFMGIPPSPNNVAKKFDLGIPSGPAKRFNLQIPRKRFDLGMPAKRFDLGMPAKRFDLGMPAKRFDLGMPETRRSFGAGKKRNTAKKFDLNMP